MRKVLGVTILLITVIQFIPYGRNHKNPPVVAEPEWDSPLTRELFFRACADCHSNETNWPIYSYVAPISWLVQYDVDEGREHFNVSMWGVQEENEGDEAYEKFIDGEMPPWYYVLLHPEAEFSELEKKEFLSGLRATFGVEEEENGHETENED